MKRMQTTKMKYCFAKTCFTNILKTKLHVLHSCWIMQLFNGLEHLFKCWTIACYVNPKGKDQFSNQIRCNTPQALGIAQGLYPREFSCGCDSSSARPKECWKHLGSRSSSRERITASTEHATGIAFLATKWHKIGYFFQGVNARTMRRHGDDKYRYIIYYCYRWLATAKFFVYTLCSKGGDIHSRRQVKTVVTGYEFVCAK